MNTITLTETLVSGRTLVKYDIANAPVKEFRVRVPAAFKNVEITGAQIRRRDETNGEWRVELQSKVRGEYLLTVTWELPRGGQDEPRRAGGHPGAGRGARGGLRRHRRPAAACRSADQSGGELLSKIDVRELPPWTGRADTATVLAYRYLRPGYKLALDARRYDEAEVLQALIDNARLATVVADDGQVMTELSLSIRNNGRQHLEIELPEKTTVWSAFVAGEPVRPSVREGKLLLPLERDTASDAPVAVELTFVGQDKFPKRSGTVSLVSPKFDLPMKNARWDLYLPPDYDYSRFEGSMTRTSDATLPMEQVYSLSEYNVQQRAQEEQSKLEVRYGLESARKDLAGGNLQKAISSYSRAKFKSAKAQAEQAEGRELKELEQDVRRAQSSNLIAAQNNYFLDNAGRIGDQQALQLQAGAGHRQRSRPTAAGRAARRPGPEPVPELRCERRQPAVGQAGEGAAGGGGQGGAAAREPADPRRPLQLHPGAADRAAQADDHPPAGREHEGPKLDHALLPGRAGLCRAVGDRGCVQSAAADGMRVDPVADAVIPGSWFVGHGGHCYLLIFDLRNDMNVSLTPELESVIEEKVRSGLYSNASEVVRDALRRTFCQPQSLNLEEDTPELAALVREGVESPHTPHRKGDVRKLLDRVRRRARA